MAENTQKLKSIFYKNSLEFYKQSIASDRRTIKSHKDFIKQSKENLKILKAKKGDRWFIEYFRESIIRDSEYIKKAQERIEKNKESLAELKARQEDKTKDVDIDLNDNFQETMGHLQDIGKILDSIQMRQRKPILTVIKGGLDN